MSDTQIVTTVDESLLRLVLNAMVNLIVAKGHKQQKDYHPLMVSRWEVANWIRQQGHQVPAVDVDRALDVLCMPNSYVRYYDSDYNNNKYRYFGLIKKFWSVVEPQHTSQETVGATA